MSIQPSRLSRTAAFPLVLAALAFAPAALADAVRTLLPAAAGDLVAPALVAKSAPALPPLPDGLERKPLQFAWALSPGDAIEPPAPFRAESRGWYAELDAAELQRGHPLALTAPGAVLRLSPMGSAKAVQDADALEVLQHGRPMPAGAKQHASSAEELAAAGARFAPGTLAFRLDPKLGRAGLALRMADARGRYLLHVHEPASTVVARLQADRQHGFAGGQMQARMQLEEGGGLLPVTQVRGALAAPDGRVFDIDLRAAADGTVAGTFALPTSAAALPGLWELHAFVAASDASGQRVLRDARTSFSVGVPTARLAGHAQPHVSGAGLQVTLGVDAAVAGRYELRGVLYGRAADGSMQPFATAHAARWLDGSGSIALQFGPDLLSRGLPAPWELRHLELIDQGRMWTLETRGRALRIEQPARPAPGSSALR